LLWKIQQINFLYQTPSPGRAVSFSSSIAKSKSDGSPDKILSERQKTNIYTDSNHISQKSQWPTPLLRKKTSFMVDISISRGDNPVKSPAWGRFTWLKLKKDGIEILSWPHLAIMFPQFYQFHLEKQLKPAEYLTLKIWVYLLQSQKQVNIELLAKLLHI
jgi:hypothetical protein